MTLLNTINNLGGKWSQTFFLWLVDVISWKQCILESHLSNSSTASLYENKCASKEEMEICTKGGGKCQTNVDGYYIEFFMNVVYGMVFYVIGKRLIEYLEKLPIDDWHVLSKNNEVKIENEATSDEKIALNASTDEK
jgi:PAT family acetyl-CoA transporter-like MFS transporter 1